MKRRNMSFEQALAILAVLITATIVTTVLSKHNSNSTETVITPADLVSADESNSGHTYNKKGFADDYITYSIEDSSCVIYHFYDTYLLGKPSETDTGVSYWSIEIGGPTFRAPELIGVSNKYLIFSVKDSSNTDERIDIAVEIEETQDGYLNDSFHRSFMLDELSDEEKANIHAVHMLEEN